MCTIHITKDAKIRHTETKYKIKHNTKIKQK